MNLEMTTTTTNGPRGEFYFIFHSAKSQRTHSFRVKYVVCPPTKVVKDFTELFLSTVWLSFPSLAAKNIHKERDINNVCELNKLDLAAYIFPSVKSQRRHLWIRNSFRVWYVQCLAKRLALNLIEFIQLKVWRSLDSIAVKHFMTNIYNIQRLSFYSAVKLCSGKSNFRSWK